MMMVAHLRRLPSALALAACAIGCSHGGSTGGTTPPAAPTPARRAGISAASLRTRLYAYSDDSMMGRESGTPSNIRSTAYIEREARRIGLTPAGDNGTFFQTVPLVRRAITPGSTLTVDGTPLVLGTDYVPAAQTATTPSIDGASVIYGGQFGDTLNMITADLARGKVVVLGLPNGVRRLFLPRIARTSRLASAAAVVVPNLDGAPPALIEYLRTPRVGIGGPTSAPTQPLPMVILTTSAAASTLLGAPVDGAKTGGLGKVVHGSLAVTESPAEARNVVAMIPGSDPQLKGEYVAIGAHSDHIGVAAQAVDHDSLRAYNEAEWVLRGRSPDGPHPDAAQLAAIHINVDSLHKVHPARRDSINNGADDDGSGSVSVLEIAQAFAGAPQKPRRSILFVWHTGEEKGLLGSQWFTDHPTVSLDSVVAQLNMDMVGRGGANDIKGGGPTYLELVGSRRLSTELGDIVEAVNQTEPMPFTFDYAFDANGHPENIYCRSDHANYARYGVPVTFFTTGLHEDYHQVTDEPQYIDYEHMARVDKFVFDVATRVANLDHRPVVDKPKPDPTAPCRQ